MASPNAILTLNGISTQVVVSEGGIVDTGGHAVSLPVDVTIDSDNGNLLQNGQVIGKIAAIPSTPLSTNTNGSTTSTTSGSTVGAATVTAAAAATTPTTAPAAAAVTGGVGELVSDGAGSGEIFAGTRNLDDGGARLPITADESGDGGGGSGVDAEGKIDPHESGGGGGGGGDGSEATSGDDGLGDGDANPNEGYWGEGNLQHEKAPAGTYDSVKAGGIDRLNSVMSKIGMGVGAVSALAKIGYFAKFLGKYGKGLGVAGVVLGGWGVFSGTLDMLRNGFSWGGLLGLASSAVGVMIGVSLMMNITLTAALVSNPVGWAIIGGAILAAFIYNWLKPKEDNEAKASEGDVVGATNTIAPAPPGWAQVLPNQNVFMMLAGVTAVGLGFGFDQINLAANGPSVYQQIIPASLVPTFNSRFTGTMQKATDTTVPSLLGNIFIKKGEGGGNDKVVYVTQFTDNEGPCADPTKPCEAVNMVELNKGGYLVSDVAPDNKNSLMPFFGYGPNGVAPNPKAFNGLGQMSNLVKVPLSNASPQGAATAVNMAAFMGHRAVEIPVAPPVPTQTSDAPDSGSSYPVGN